MADSKTDPAQNDPPAEPDAEETFWAKMDARLDAAIDRKVEQFRGTGSSRTGGRQTATGFLADIMFGKPADKK